MDTGETKEVQKVQLLSNEENITEIKLTQKLFFGNNLQVSDESDEEDNSNIALNKNDRKKVAVWNDDSDDSTIDEDDLQIKKKRRRQNYIEKNLEQHKWAKVTSTEEKKYSDSEDDELEDISHALSRTAGRYIKKTKKLGTKTINFNQVKDITIGYHKNKFLQSVKFHPSRPVLMTASYSGQISMFKVCEPDNLKKIEKNNYLQHIKIKNFRLINAEYYADGAKVLASSFESRCLYSYDLLQGVVSELFLPRKIQRFTSGNFTVSSCGSLIALIGDISEVYILNANTLEIIATFVASSRIISVTFSKTTRNEIYGFTDNGDVYLWNLTAKGEQNSFPDKGCIHGSKIAISPNDQFLACGSNTGFINIYDVTKAKIAEFGSSLEPIYTISNLITDANLLAFNNTSEIMAYGSSIKSMQMKLYNLGSGTTYENFPHVSEVRSMDKLMCVDFSPNSGFIAFGTQNGSLKMYRLNHFTSY